MIPMLWQVSWFLCFLQHLLQDYEEWNLMGASVLDWLRFFFLFAKNYYFKQKLTFLINTLSETFFEFGSDKLNAAICKTLMLKKYFNSWRKYFLVRHFIENQVFGNFRVVFMFFSVCSLFKLMQLICQWWSCYVYVI